METDIKDIIIAKLHGEKLSDEDAALFDKWHRQPGNAKHFYEWQRLENAIYANSKSTGLETGKAWEKLSKQTKSRTLIPTFLKYAAAAFILVSIGIASYKLYKPSASVPVAEGITVQMINQQATLTLSNGKQISLTDSTNRTLTQEDGTVIRQNAPNALVYDKSEKSKEQLYNTIYIPRGGEYKLTLSDGTIVWLNSETRLTFPVAFNGSTRELSLEGEAFFEVATDKSKPFIVHTQQFNIRVTGTQFNVRSYPDESESATLAEGRIQLEKDDKIHRLIPGQQAVVKAGQIIIHQADMEEAIAWRNEAFCFKQARLEYIMNELARWYDLDVFYLTTTSKDLHFTAWFHRSSSISEVITILEKTQKIKLELKGKTLIVHNK